MTQFQVGPPAVAGLSHRARPSGDSESRTPGRPAAGTSPLPTSKGLSRCLPSGPPAGTAKLVQRQPASLSEAASDSPGLADSATGNLNRDAGRGLGETDSEMGAALAARGKRFKLSRPLGTPMPKQAVISDCCHTPIWRPAACPWQCHGSEAGPAALGTLNTVMKANFD